MEQIKQYLKDNKEYFIEKTKVLREQKETFASCENSIFFEDINKQYNERIKFLIANDICNRLATDYESVYIILESIDLELFLCYNN